MVSSNKNYYVPLRIFLKKKKTETCVYSKTVEPGILQFHRLKTEMSQKTLNPSSRPFQEAIFDDIHNR